MKGWEYDDPLPVSCVWTGYSPIVFRPLPKTFPKLKDDFSFLRQLSTVMGERRIEFAPTLRTYIQAVRHEDSLSQSVKSLPRRDCGTSVPYLWSLFTGGSTNNILSLFTGKQSRWHVSRKTRKSRFARIMSSKHWSSFNEMRQNYKGKFLSLIWL